MKRRLTNQMWKVGKIRDAFPSIDLILYTVGKKLSGNSTRKDSKKERGGKWNVYNHELKNTLRVVQLILQSIYRGIDRAFLVPTHKFPPQFVFLPIEDLYFTECIIIGHFMSLYGSNTGLNMGLSAAFGGKCGFCRFGVKCR